MMEEIIEYFKNQLETKKSTLNIIQVQVAQLEKFIAELERTISNPPN